MKKYIMPTLREAQGEDIPAIALLRSDGKSGENYWTRRVTDYLELRHHPQEALTERIILVAVENEVVVGMVAGHLSRRFGLAGELQWLDVLPSWRRKGVAGDLLKELWAWFLEKKAHSVCVNCAPENTAAWNFYSKSGATPYNNYWLIWEDIRNK